MDRYKEICELLKPFLAQTGFLSSKTKFVPVGAMQGINLLHRDDPNAKDLNSWYKGPTLVDLLGAAYFLLSRRLCALPLTSSRIPDVLDTPARDFMSPFRFPIANVFKGQSSGIAVSGRICGGLVQIGEKLRVLPGDDTAIVKS